MASTPMPVRVDVSLTVREDGSPDGVPVLVLTAVDIEGATQVWHLGQDAGMELVGDLAVGLCQLYRGASRMPY